MVVVRGDGGLRILHLGNVRSACVLFLTTSNARFRPFSTSLCPYFSTLYFTHITSVFELNSFSFNQEFLF